MCMRRSSSSGVDSRLALRSARSGALSRDSVIALAILLVSSQFARALI